MHPVRDADLREMRGYIWLANMDCAVDQDWLRYIEACATSYTCMHAQNTQTSFISLRALDYMHFAHTLKWIHSCCISVRSRRPRTW